MNTLLVESLPSHELLHPEEVAIVTSTFYRGWYPGEVESEPTADKIRGDLALQTIQTAMEKGYHLVVVDGHVNDSFVEALSNLGVTTLEEEEQTMSGARQQGFQEAAAISNVKVITWTEPEKVSIVQDCVATCVLPILDGEADIVVPKRDETAFAAYPDYQVDDEKLSNKRWNRALRSAGLLHKDEEDLDAWFGPRFIRNDPALVKLFCDSYEFEPRLDDTTSEPIALDKLVRPELWANATFLPIIAALEKGYKVKSVDVEYRHPSKQTAVEQGSAEYQRKRAVQRRNIITSTVHLLRLVQNRNGAKQLKKIN